jgi:broad specificity phosphatase PhoE
LRECNYGALNGTPAAGLERAKHITEPFPEGESYQDVVARMQSFLEDISRDWDGKRVLIIGHTATRWALDVLISGEHFADLVDGPFGWREGWNYSLK